MHMRQAFLILIRSSQHFSLSKNRHTLDLDYYGYLMSRDRYLGRTLARRLVTARANNYKVVDLNPPHSIRSKEVSQPEVNPTDIILIDPDGVALELGHKLRKTTK